MSTLKSSPAQVLMGDELRLLIIEDNSNDLLLMIRELRALGRPLNLRHVATEVDFHVALQEFTPEIVLSDLELPGFHGLKALTLVQEKGWTMPFIFVSGVIDGESAVQLLKQGATDYVLKDRLYRLPSVVERALRETATTQECLRAERNYQGLFENAVLGIYQLTLTGRYVAANPALAHLLGHQNPAEMLATSQHFSECFVDPKRAEDFFAELSGRGKTHNFEAELCRRDGSRFWAACHARIVPPIHGTGALCEGFIEDRTHQREMEAQIQRAKRLESIDTLAGGVAHDLNNILAPILMAATMLRTSTTKPEHTRMLGLIEESSERGMQIIKQVLAFRSDAEDERSVLQINYLLKEVFKVVADTFPTAITFENSLERNLRVVKGNGAQLRQAVLALCTNARDAMPEMGNLHIATRNVELSADALAAMSQNAPPGQYVVVEVRDTGTGISPEILDRVFDPFFTTKGVGKGTGLGLSEVCGIVKKHEGFIEVSSPPGVGTTFQVFLPASDGKEGSRLAPAPTPTVNGERGQTILLVDDEGPIRLAARTILDTRHYRVLTASNGVEALDLYQQHQQEIQLVVTDSMMPRMDGATLIRSLRQLEPNLPVVLSSGRVDKALEEELQTLKIQARLDKPYTMRMFLDTVEQALKARPEVVPSS